MACGGSRGGYGNPFLYCFCYPLKRDCSGDSGTRKPVLLRLDDRSEVVRFCRLFALLRAILLVLACFVFWAEWFTCRPRLEIDNRRRSRNPRTGLS
ncbi:hypothetical protein CRG98_023506 [Punica granatum]|uniref:Transmembrane protein n=1 Tax=Punica granatum TaxID=22663 RepID=A0A2I0JJK3_PUNGR|nr:hypothetical protein CRG98_023506 [Punica granatum]